MHNKTYSTPLGLTSQFAFCGLPLRLDSYAGCAFRCSYCFARYRGGNTYGENIRPADPQKVSKIFHSALGDNDASKQGILAQFLRQRVPVHFGGMSDPFQPSEARYHITASILHILAAFEYPTVISTKGSMVATEPYINLLSEIKHVVVQFSFSSSVDNIAKRIEPFSSPPNELLKTMEKLSRMGLNVTCRWQPFIRGVSEAPSEFVSRVASTGCRHIGLEHLKIPVEQHHPLWSNFTNGVKRDLHDEYRQQGAYLDGREYILPAKEKLSLVLEAAQITRKQGLTFGAADNEFQYLSDTDCCCSGVDQFPGFENWYKYQIGYAVRKCRGKKISYDAISQEWRPIGSVDRYLNSNSRLSRRGKSLGTMTDHILTKWNNPNAPGSPASFYGISPTSETTAAGNRVYQWVLAVGHDSPNAYALASWLAELMF